jgi:hypothetical protein
MNQKDFQLASSRPIHQQPCTLFCHRTYPSPLNLDQVNRVRGFPLYATLRRKNISKTAHPHRDLSTALRFGRDDKGEGGASRKSSCWIEVGGKASGATMPQISESTGTTMRSRPSLPSGTAPRAHRPKCFRQPNRYLKPRWVAAARPDCRCRRHGCEATGGNFETPWETPLEQLHVLS